MKKGFHLLSSTAAMVEVTIKYSQIHNRMSTGQAISLKKKREREKMNMWMLIITLY